MTILRETEKKSGRRYGLPLAMHYYFGIYSVYSGISSNLAGSVKNWVAVSCG